MLSELWDSIVLGILKLLEKVRANLDKIDGLILAIITGLSVYLPDTWIKWITSSWFEIRRMIVRELDRMIEDLRNVGDPAALEQMCDDWKERIGKPVGLESVHVNLLKTTVEEEWSGKGADEYRKQLPQQTQALGDFQSDVVKVIGNALFGAASGISGFGTKLSAAIVGLSLAVVGTAATLGSALPSPATPALLVSGLATLGIGAVQIRMTIDEAHESLGQSVKESKEGMRDAMATPVMITGWPHFAMVMGE